ncbi:hypothetical protein PMZ80_005594 [Knufia obscura]|uniref:Uncharacterized protein n=1 Tax=Knufia obscura TaxID=1635080 RepID=A0ABR0RMZ7_9EURO|nr:hypothetical protein PMZ80_005594 [Knufia obscura]
MRLTTLLTLIVSFVNSPVVKLRWPSNSLFDLGHEPLAVNFSDPIPSQEIEQRLDRNLTIEKRVETADGPAADHIIFRLFDFQNFPANDQNTRRNQAAQACIEAIIMLVDSLQAMNNMDDTRIENSFHRYFNQEHVGEVKLVIESLVRQLGGPIFEGAQHCIPAPELLPLLVWYGSPPQIPNLCDGTLLALPEVLDAAGDPVEPSVQYMVICPRWYENGKWRLLDDIKQEQQPYWATSFGYGASISQPGAGLESASSDIVHELLHWWSFLGNFANAVIEDEAFLLEDLGFNQETEARTPWLALQMKTRKPKLCTSNDENYMWFIREAFYTRRWNKPGNWWDALQDIQPGDPYVTPDNRLQGFDKPG